MIWPRLYLPLLALASGVVLWVLGSNLLVAPVVMLLVWSYWLAMIVGVVLTLRFNFVAGLVGAIAINLGLFLIVEVGSVARLWVQLIYSPVLPLAIIQLVAAPFQFRAAAAAGHTDT